MAARPATLRAAVLVAAALSGPVFGCATFYDGEIDFGVPEGDYVRTDRGRTFVLDRGEGPAVLLVHGYGSAHDVYLGLIERLLAEGYRVLAVDLPGFGRSDRRPGDYSPEGLARHLVEVLDARGIERVDVVAHSWGSSIALRLALEHPGRIGRLVLTSAWVYEDQIPPFLSWSRVPGIGEALYGAFYLERAGDRFELSFHDPDRFVTQEAVDTVERALARPGTVRAALEAGRSQRFAEVERRYREVEAETLLVWGRQDRVSLPAYGTRLEADLPRSHLVLLDRCGHIPMIERAHRFEALVVEFLGAPPRPGPDEPRVEPAPIVGEPVGPDWGPPPPPPQEEEP